MKDIENSIFIKNTTPKKNLLLDYLLKQNTKKVKSKKGNKSIKKSFSPRVNKLLVSYTRKKPKNFFLCSKDFLNINIGSKKNKKCVNYKSKEAQEFLLNNLKSIKKINCKNIIPPRQVLSNCWFNTFFVTFFISDKGRKFFKFFRQLMILGKTVDGKVITKELREAFFILNIAIESSYNPSLKNIALSFNTNLLIKKIYNTINKNHKFNDHIPNIDEAGNPLDYYLTIINYLNANNVNILPLTLTTNAKNSTIEKLINDRKIKNKPDIIILEIADYSSISIDDKSQELDIFGVKYKLDAAIIRDTNQQHFCSLLTCNKKQFAFDGASFNKFSLMNWKEIINKNIIWRFEGHNLTWNFRLSYQILFYYREN